MSKKSRSRGCFDEQHGKRVQDCGSFYRTTMIQFIDHFQGNFVQKNLSYLHAKYWDWLLTHWLPMKSIFFFIGTI